MTLSMPKIAPDTNVGHPAMSIADVIQLGDSLQKHN
jgi:hypothetical protein